MKKRRRKGRYSDGLSGIDILLWLAIFTVVFCLSAVIGNVLVYLGHPIIK